MGESLLPAESLLVSPTDSDREFQTPVHSDGSDSLDLSTTQKHINRDKRGLEGMKED